MISQDRKELFFKKLSELKTKSEELGVPLNNKDLVLKVIDIAEGDKLRLISTKTFKQNDLDLIDKYRKISSRDVDQNFEIRLFPVLNRGSNYIPITAKKVTSGEENIIFHSQGEILLIDFWASWCGPCLKAMQHNLEMIEKNKDVWKGKVRILSVSLEENLEEVATFLKENEWNKYENILEHYISIQGEGKDFQAIYEFYSIPHVILVDKWSKISYLGHPSSKPTLEERINDLLEKTSNAEDLSLKEFEFFYIDSDLEEKKIVIESFSKLAKEFSEHLNSENVKYNSNLRLKSWKTFQLNEDLSEITVKSIDHCELEVSLRSAHYMDFINKLNSAIPNLENLSWLELKLEKLETFDIVPGHTCNVCQGSIPENTNQYYCYWCKVSFCEKCVEARLENEGRAKLVHPDHNLLLFKTRNKELLSQLDLHKLGKNLFKDFPDSKLSQMHGYNCNGSCGPDQIPGPRFVCVSCEPGRMQSDGFVDYCKDCVKIMDNPQHERHSEVCNSTASHIHADHVYLMLVFEGDDYYNY